MRSPEGNRLRGFFVVFFVVVISGCGGCGWRV